MFKFNGTLAELRTYLDATFTKKAQKVIDMEVFAHNRTVHARGNYRDVRDMLRLVFTEKHLETLQLSVDIIQPSWQTTSRIREFDSQHIPADVTLEEVLHMAKTGMKIGAIKAYRQLTGVGLVDAKDYIEKYLGQA